MSDVFQKDLLPLPILTPRLLLRLPRLEDVDVVHEAKAALWPDLQKWMSWSSDDQKSYEATKDFIESQLEPVFEDENLKQATLFGFCRETGAFVISGGFNPPSKEGAAHFETGYWVAKDFQGQGLATEATNAVIRYVFDVGRARNVGINYYADNHASRRVIEKLGFRYVSTDKQAHTSFLGGEIMDVHHYIMDDVKALPPLEVSWGQE